MTESEEHLDTPEETAGPRFATVALVGRPNAGKSTLLNSVLQQKVSIVSAKPQTTRNRIVGIFNDPRGQLVFLDTPGIHKPLHRLNVRMMDHVRSALSEADILTLIVDVTEPFGKGDEFVIEMMRQERQHNPDAVRVALLNKIDLVKKQKLLPLIQQYSGFGLFDHIVPIAAQMREGIDELVDLLFKAAEPGMPRFPADDFTTQPERFFAAEIVREKVLIHTENELPYTTAVAIERYEEDEEKNLLRIYATIFVERDSQKPIIVGKQGSMIKRIGTEARQELEAILGARVFLDLHVAVHERWRDDQRFLGELEWPLREE